MLKGICFESSENFFNKLNAVMDVSQYDWYIDDTEMNYYCFREGKYSGDEFKNVLPAISSLSFARIRRYPTGSPTDRIDGYEDFIMSDCDLLMLFYDGGFYEIYGKQEKLLLYIMKMCRDDACQTAEYVSDSEIGRSYMHF